MLPFNYNCNVNYIEMHFFNYKFFLVYLIDEPAGFFG